MACPVSMEKLATRSIDPLIGMGAEEIPLRLQKVCRKPLTSIAIKKCKGRAKARDWNAMLYSLHNSMAEPFLTGGHLPFKEVVKEQIFKRGAFVVGLLNVIEEATADDTPFPPNKGNSALVEVPAIF
jgi:hypothetical protein